MTAQALKPKRRPVSVGDPTAFGSTVVLTVDRALAGEGAEWRDELGATRLVVPLPDGMEAGKTVTRMFERVDWWADGHPETIWAPSSIGDCVAVAK